MEINTHLSNPGIKREIRKYFEMNKNENIVYQICGRTSLVKNLPSNAGDLGSIPGRGTKIPHAMGQLSLNATNTEPACSRGHGTAGEKPAQHNEKSHVLH